MLRTLIKQTRSVFAPPPDLSVSEWADKFRVLSSESSAAPGQWSTVPYQRGMMDAFNDPSVRGIVVMSAAQIGKTEFINNVVGYHIDQDPAPILMVQPTLEMAQTWSKDRLAPMLRDTPQLHGKVKDAKSRNSGNTMLHKTFPGGHITMSGANSPASLASRPIRIVLCDEVDRFPVSAGTEGDPVNLALKRSATFWNRKYLLTSTPTIKGHSRIERAYEGSDQRRYFVPCPHCDHKQVLVRANIVWGDTPDDAHYVCESCGQDIDERHKQGMLLAGEWIATADFNGVAGFHINELYSPWRYWSEVIVDFLEAKKNRETLKTFVNTSLGETWEEDGEQPDSMPLMERREDYGSAAPDDVLVVTAGVDIQADRIEVEAVGFGLGGESWGLGERIFYGDTTRAEPWEDLDIFLQSQFKTSDGRNLPIACTCIDSGYHTQIVYDFVQTREYRRVYAIKGVPGQGRPLVSAPTRKQSGKIKRKINLFTVGVDGGKGQLYANLKVTEPGPGYCHFPMEYGEEFFLQLTSEKMGTRYQRGRPVLVWEKTRPRNEALDRRVYAMAAFRLIDPDMVAIAAKRNAPDKRVGKTRKKRVPRRNFVSRWQ